MKISMTFRHLETTAAIKSYVREKVSHVQRYLVKPSDAQVVLSLDRYLHVADITITAGSRTFKGKEESDDMYTSIDRVIDKIERQIRKVKGQLRARKRSGRGLAAAIRVKAGTPEPEAEPEPETEPRESGVRLRDPLVEENRVLAPRSASRGKG